MSRITSSMHRFLPLGVLIFLSGVLIVLYILSSSIDSADRTSVELKIRQIVALDTDLNLDTLRLRYRLLLNYDNIADKSRKIDHTLDSLRPEFRKLRLEHTLQQVINEWGRKQTSLEDFKRQNSVLVNSQFHFVNLDNQISRALEAKKTYFAHFDETSRSLLVFISGQPLQSNEALLSDLDRLGKDTHGWPSELNEQRQILIAHGKQIVNTRPQVQTLIRRVANSEFPDYLERAYAEYMDVYNHRISLAETYRQLMAVFALLMIGIIVLIAIRLRKTSVELARNHTLLNNIADHLGEGILSFDTHGRLNFVNQRAKILLRLEDNDLINHAAQELFPEDKIEKSSFLAALAKGEHFEGEEWLQRADGRFPASFLGGPLLVSSENKQIAGGYVTSFRDVTVQRETNARLRLASRVFDNLSEAMSITDPRGVIESVNAAFTTITGYTELEARGHTPGNLLGSGLHDKEFFRDMWKTLAREGKWQGEITNRKKNGERYQCWLSITTLLDFDNQVLHYIALFTDISERKRIEARVHYLAYHDPLTKLANRLQFIERLQTHMTEAHHPERPLAVMLLDLDRFKYINDSLSHAAGDELLKYASQRLSQALGDGDLLARVGGDEFALLLPNVTMSEDVAELARHILHEFDRPFNLHGREIFVSASIGIAMYPEDGEEAEVLLKSVDTALYKAKDSGRSTFRFFQESDNENALERLELETELRHSVPKNELRLYYQPQIDAKTGTILGMEALVRWQHPVRGLLSPDRFISLAEVSGYIDTLGTWCLHTACHQFIAWQKLGLPMQRVSVNVSARQLNSPVFVEMVLSTIEEAGIPPSCLELELTESAMIGDPERVFAIFTQLRGYGIRIAIDDFGTGYSSLSYLSRYPVDVVKIDKSFVRNLVSEQQNRRSVVQAIILMAHAMGMEVVAEGVETEAQSQRLKDYGCNLLQGFLFARPCAPEQVLELLNLRK